MLKKLKILLFIGLLSGLFYGWFLYKSRLTLIVPYPYKVVKTNYEDKAKAENANVLIIGDRMGLNLKKFTPDLIRSLSVDLKEPIKIFNWAEDRHGLHRTLAKLKSLKKVPKIVVYHGASQEFFEKKFLINDKKIFSKNIKRYQDDRILSLILTVPQLSRFLYERPKKYFILRDIIEDQTQYNALQKQMQLEMAYTIYQWELEELVTFVKEKESTLILMTTPVNLDSSPKLICQNAHTDNIAIEQLDLEKLLKNDQVKEAYKKLLALTEQTPANARSYYLLGQASKRLGNIVKAKQELTKAAAFDCSTWRATPVHNAIIRRVSGLRSTLLLDFDTILNREYGQNELFVHDIYPQNLFYNQIMKSLGGMIKNIYKL